MLCKTAEEVTFLDVIFYVS